MRLPGQRRELVGRVREAAGSDPAKAAWPERAPMDRDRVARSQHPEGLGGPFRCEVPTSQTRAPTPYGKEGHVEVRRELRHLGKQVRVASEIGPELGRLD